MESKETLEREAPAHASKKKAEQYREQEFHNNQSRLQDDSIKDLFIKAPLPNSLIYPMEI